MDERQKEQVMDLFRTNPFGVIATVGPNAPQSAVITIAATANLEIVFGSLSQARKNKNITRNPNVSLVVGWDGVVRRTLQIEGVVTMLSPEAYEAKKAQYIVPRTLVEGGARDYFVITPHWMRYSDFGAHPKEIWEVVM